MILLGHGAYSAADWSKLKTSRGISSVSNGKIFRQNRIDPRFNPCFIGARESRDSSEHPDSTPVIIGVDVTGSMEYLSESIIKNSLHELMMKFYSTDTVKDPQLMFSAIGDVCDSAPLQVTQFESDIRIAEQLLDLWIEGRGGDAAEDYELLWYFAAYHTDTDCFKKRRKKGYCFTIGDAGCHDFLSADNVQEIFGDKVRDAFSSKQLAEAASEKYELFHIMIGSDYRNFGQILPGRVMLIDKSDVEYLPEIIFSAIQFSDGIPLQTILAQWSSSSAAVVKSALSDVNDIGEDYIKF